ncbi:amidohydrolase [Streptomyces sp. OR43]|uniref:amidohydrolase n=1 Tax=Streptomyces sp. or43 TaxID=2478957 RepID=UPI0011CE17D6|nr:amidohydrolase [Streptomyces sp. or43]TXS38454.1 M20 family peptidase [Streptomyces sp. or43]
MTSPSQPAGRPDRPVPSALSALHDRITREVSDRAARLWDVALALHRDPELAFEEYFAADLLSGELERAGFAVTRGVADMGTAFVAEAGDGNRPRVALLLEYDALPGLGHACGHNLIAAAGLGAALALHSALRSEPGPGPPGTVMAVGTPAEEGGGGKAVQVAAGVFDDVDAALMFHPGVNDWVRAPLTAQIQLRTVFHGRAAHPTGNPTDGVDALAALVQMFGALNVLQRRLPPGSHVQGIVTDGGRATNIVPARAEGLFGLRAATTDALEALVAQVTRCAQGTADATGTTAETSRATTGYHHFRDNDVLSDRFARHLRAAGITLGPPTPGVFLGSSDIGNVSTAVPSIHPFVAILGPGHSDHTPEFAEAAAGESARRVMLASALALARTAADLLVEPGFSEMAWKRQREKPAAGT